MADPILQNVYRVQVAIPSVTGLPEDVIVNSFAFRGPWSSGSPEPGEVLPEMLAINSAFDGLYDIAGQLRPPSLVTNELWVKWYLLSQEPPREPLAFTRTLPAITMGEAMPEEVAVVLSLYGERNLPRTRGRIFLGPWKQSAVEVVAGRARIKPATRNAIRDKAIAFATAVNSTGATWGIISQANANFVPIRNAWVDDAFDTQRSRGTKASERLTFAIPSPPV